MLKDFRGYIPGYSLVNELWGAEMTDPKIVEVKDGWVTLRAPLGLFQPDAKGPGATLRLPDAGPLAGFPRFRDLDDTTLRSTPRNALQRAGLLNLGAVAHFASEKDGVKNLLRIHGIGERGLSEILGELISAGVFPMDYAESLVKDLSPSFQRTYNAELSRRGLL